MYWQEGMGRWMMFGGVWMLLFWGGIIALIVWVIKKLMERRNSGSGTSEKRSSLDIAKERYARGEIAKDEFEQIKRGLS